MAITIFTNPTVPVLYKNCTVTVAGATGATKYMLVVSHPGGDSQNFNVTTDGGGGASVKYVPNTAGSVTYTLNLASSQAAQVTSTHSSG